MSRRVVVTGLGAITPIGNSVEEFWNGLKAKKSESVRLPHLILPSTRQSWQVR